MIKKLFLIVLFLLFASQASAFDYYDVTGANQFLATDAQSYPSLLGSYLDVYGTTVRRMTDQTSSVQPNYTARTSTVENSDGTLLAVNSVAGAGSAWEILTVADGVTRATLTAYLRNGASAYDHFVWSPTVSNVGYLFSASRKGYDNDTYPARFYKITINLGTWALTADLLYTFTTAVMPAPCAETYAINYVKNHDEGPPSWDGRFWNINLHCSSFYNENSPHALMLFDKDLNGTDSPGIKGYVLPAAGFTTHYASNAGVSPGGNYWFWKEYGTARGCYGNWYCVRFFPVASTSGAMAHSAATTLSNYNAGDHWDTQYDDLGNEVYVSGHNTLGHVYWRFNTAPSSPIVVAPWTYSRATGAKVGDTHSVPAGVIDGPRSWFAILTTDSAYTECGGENLGNSTITYMRLSATNPKTFRVAHARHEATTYGQELMGGSSRDGNKLYFQSNWCTPSTYTSQLFRVELPSSWWLDFLDADVSPPAVTNVTVTPQACGATGTIKVSANDQTGVAGCKYGAASNFDYDSGSLGVMTLSGAYHQATPSVTCGNSYTYYAKCRDTTTTPGPYTTVTGVAMPMTISPVPDTVPPTVTGFVIPSTSTSLTVDITTFTASDDTAVTGYCLVETNNSAGCSWGGSAPSTYVFSTQGTKTLYAFAKDAAGNISDSLNDSVTIVLPGSIIFQTNFDGCADWTVTQTASNKSNVPNTWTYGQTDFPCGINANSGTGARWVAWYESKTYLVSDVSNTVNLNSANARSGKAITHSVEVPTSSSDGNASDGTLYLSLTTAIGDPTQGYNEIWVTVWRKFDSVTPYYTAQNMQKFIHVSSYDASKGSITDWFSDKHLPSLIQQTQGNNSTDLYGYKYRWLSQWINLYPNANREDYTWGTEDLDEGIYKSGAGTKYINTYAKLQSGTQHGGWQQSGNYGDGNYYCHEYHLKMNSAPGVADGVYEYFINGIAQVSVNNVSFVKSGAQMVKWNSVVFGGNNDYYNTGGEYETWYAYDDIVVSDYRVTEDYIISASTLAGASLGGGVTIH